MPAAPARRSSTALLGLALLAAPALAALPAAGASAPPAGPLAHDVAQAESALARAGSARVTIVTDDKGQRSSETIDSATGKGTATATENGEVLHILYADHTIFLQAKSAVLASVLGMPTTLADAYGGRWLSAPTTVASIARLAQLFSLGTFAKSVIALGGPLVKGSQTSSGGSTVVAVRGRIPKTAFNQGSGGGDRATLLVRTASPHYPVSVTFSDASTGTTHVSFLDWGEKIDAAVPARATPLSSLEGSSTTTTG